MVGGYGYAYPNVDSDEDGLIDGFEYLIGTDPMLADTAGAGGSCRCFRVQRKR